MKRYILVSVMIIIGTIMIAVSLQDRANEEESSQSVTTTLPLFQREDSPIYEETDETLAIPDPCVILGTEKISGFVSPAKQRGPLLQTAIAPTKSCEWFPADESRTEPRLTISIAANENYFDSLIGSSIEEVEMGEEAHVIEGQSNAIGGATCGKTLMVKFSEYSYVVGLCKAGAEEVLSSELINLAEDISAALETS